MRTFGKVVGLAAAAVFGGAVSASAALLDFTDLPFNLTGSINGVGYTITGVPEAPSGDSPSPAPCAFCGPLALENDGLGIKDDEVTTTSVGTQYITVSFDEAVALTGVYYLDLFKDPTTPSDEVAYITVGSAPGSIDVTTNANFFFSKGKGYAENLSFREVGTDYTFFVGRTNDGAGRADAALAALQISAVPLPAGLLLMGTALGGLAVSRRRKKA